MYNSAVLFYDRQTGSLWAQIRTQAISGELKGARIGPIPTAHTAWRERHSRYRESEVLSFDTGFRRSYGDNAYEEYQHSRDLMFPVTNRSGRYPKKSKVLGVRLGRLNKAYPFNEYVGEDLLTIRLPGEQ